MQVGEADLRQWLRQPVAWAILAVGTVISLFAWRALTLEVEHAARLSFDAMVAESRHALDTRLRDYHLILVGLQGLLEAKPDLDRTRFQHYIENLGASGTATHLRTISFAERVPRGQLAQLERRVRAEGYPEFAVHPAGERDEHVVLVYLAPFTGKDRNFGLDLMADAERRRSVELTRDTGEVVATGPIALVSSASGERGVSLRLAVYRTDNPMRSHDERRRMFTGIASVTFAVGDVAADIIGRHAASSLALRVLDGGTVLYDSGGTGADRLLGSNTVLKIGGRSWDMQFSAPFTRFRTAGDALMPWLALIGGLAITALLTGLVGSLSTSTQRAHRIAREITEDLRRSQAELMEAQRKTEQLLETLPNPVFFKDTDGRYLGVNKAWEAFFLRPRDSIVGRTVDDLYPHAPQIAARMQEADQALWTTPGTQSYEAAVVLPDGTQRDTIYYKATITGPEGRIAGLVGTIIDITERKLAEKRQAMEHAITRALASADEPAGVVAQVMRIVCQAMGWTGGAQWRWDAHERELRYTGGWATPAGEALLEAAASTDGQAPGQARGGALWRAFSGGQPVVAEEHEMHGALCFPLVLGGETLGVMAFFGAQRSSDRNVSAMLHAMGGQMAQYVVRLQAEDALRFVATHDALTALPNRVMFGQRLDHAIEQGKRHARRLALLFIDLDRFKVINDTLGHEFGDRLLRDVAQRLRQSVRSSDTVARLGGDEFVVLLEEVSAPLFVASVAQKLISTLTQGFALAGREYHVSASIGVATYPDDAPDAQELLKCADIAMYRAKEQGRNTFQFYAAEHNVHTVERLTLESGLRRALERGQLVLHYQPQVHFASGRIVGMEALVRWQHPELGLLPPASFISIAEETGLIVPIGQWVMHTAFSARQAWVQAGLPALRMSVNLSPRQFLSPELIAEIARAVPSGEATALELELTEGMVMQDPERAVQLLRDIHDLGVRIAIDDFGTGHSSLAYLKRFPIDNLKIDRSFIADIPADRGDAAITQAIIAMAHSLGLSVIAEGVETQPQFDFLAAQGCDEYQGYFFSRPLPEEQVRDLLGPAGAKLSASAA